MRMKDKFYNSTWQKGAAALAVAGVVSVIAATVFFSPGEEPASQSAAMGDINFKSESPYRLYTQNIESPGGSSLELFRRANFREDYSGPGPGGTFSSKAPASFSAAEMLGGVSPFEDYEKPEIEMETPGGSAPPATGINRAGSGEETPIPGSAARAMNFGAENPENAPPRLQENFNLFSGPPDKNFNYGSRGSGRFGMIEEGVNSTFSGNTFSGSNLPTGSRRRNSRSPNRGGGESGNSSHEDSESGGTQFMEDTRRPPEPVMVIWPQSLKIGNVEIYGSASRKAFIMNTGDAPLGIREISNLDDNNSPFYLKKNSCANKTLQPGEKCDLEVVFSPSDFRKRKTAFEIKTNDTGLGVFQNYLFAEGKALSFRYYWWQRWHFSYWKHKSGTIGTLDFGTVPADSSHTQQLRVVNTTHGKWYNLKIRPELPRNVAVISNACSGRDIDPGGYCLITLKFSPEDGVNESFIKRYGQFEAVNIETGRKTISPHPVFPVAILGPVTGKIEGAVKIYVSYHDERGYGEKMVHAAKIKGETCAKYPVAGMRRAGKYLFFLD